MITQLVPISSEKNGNVKFKKVNALIDLKTENSIIRQDIAKQLSDVFPTKWNKPITVANTQIIPTGNCGLNVGLTDQFGNMCPLHGIFFTAEEMNMNGIDLVIGRDRLRGSGIDIISDENGIETINLEKCIRDVIQI